MSLISTILYITIHLAVIQMFTTDVNADHTSKNNLSQSGIAGNIYSNLETTTNSYIKNVISKSSSLLSSNEITCSANLSHNIINMTESDMKSLIKSQARDITKTNMNITNGLQKIQNIAKHFSKSLDYRNISHAIKLQEFYLSSSKTLLETIKEHNSLIRAYKCIDKNENNDTYEISEKEFEDNLTYNEDFTNQLRYLYKLALCYKDVYVQSVKTSKSMKQYNSSKTLDDLNMAYSDLDIWVNILKNFVEEQERFHEYLGNNNLNQIFQTTAMSRISNITYWKIYLENKEDDLKSYKQYVDENHFEDLLNKKIQPILHGIIFALGFVGNLVLLIIFARHKEMRNPPSMMILNLTLADAFNLPINIPVFLIYLTSNSWDYGEGLCIAFRFLRQLGIAVSIYSIVVISIQRFLALTQMFKTNHFWGSKLSIRLKSVLLILSVWIIGSLIATPHTIHAGVYEGQCYGAPKDNNEYARFITLFDFILFCAIPLTIIAILSVATALIIKRSVRNIPGEAMGMDKYIKTRIVSANVLIALTVVSAASYVPYYLFMLLFAWGNLEIETQEYQTIFFIVYTLMFANCCFNPIALYIFSHKFRKYIHKYLFCRKINNGIDRHKLSNATTSSSFMTKI